MAARYIDINGHEVADSNGSTLTAGAVGTTVVGTIVGTTAAGAAPTVTVTAANDRRGNFLLNPVTGGGAQAAGVVAKVFFAQPYPAAPGSVIVTADNETDTTAPITVSAANITVTGFDIISTVLTTAKAYRINYLVNV
jgi:hypothetical protein